jgi:hypothetical protein
MKETEMMDKSGTFAPLVTGVSGKPWTLILQYLLFKLIVVLQTDILHLNLKQFYISTYHLTSLLIHDGKVFH